MGKNVNRRLILIISLSLLVVLTGLVYWGQYRQRSAEVYYSGTIEATEANLAFQVSGRVETILVQEGQAVEEGQALAVVEREEFVARHDEAQANLIRLQKSLQQAESTLALHRVALPADVERSEAAVHAQEAQLAELEAGYRTQEIERARLALDETRATMEEARKDKIRLDKLFDSGVIAEKDKDAAGLRYETTLKRYQQAQESYNMLKEGFRKESVEAARSRLAEARAAAKASRSQLKRIEATERELEAARAQVEAAEAALELTRIHLSHTELKAPFSGILVSRNVEPGEVVSPGQEVFSLADLSEVNLKVFVGETEIGKVKPGQSAEVKIDTFPSKTFAGRVSFISPEAEFTPKIIQTHKERVKLVYLVKITIANPNLELKSGMPADAWFK